MRREDFLQRILEFVNLLVSMLKGSSSAWPLSRCSIGTFTILEESTSMDAERSLTVGLVIFFVMLFVVFDRKGLQTTSATLQSREGILI